MRKRFLVLLFLAVCVLSFLISCENQTTTTYMVSFFNEDGSLLLGQSEINEGETASFQGQTPEKEKTDYSVFVFDGWSLSPYGDKASLSPITGECSYYAHFSEKSRYVTISFYNDDGTILFEEQTIEYGSIISYQGKTPTKEEDQNGQYSFLGWVNEQGETFDVTLPVEESVKLYSFYSCENTTCDIKFYSNDGSILLASYSLKHGETINYSGEEPTISSDSTKEYFFIGWSESPKDSTAITLSVAKKSTNFYAVFSSSTHQCKVKFLNLENELLEEQIVSFGSSCTYKGKTPSKQSTQEYLYSFIGWVKDNTSEPVDLSSIQEDLILYPCFSSSQREYTISFYDENRKLVSEVTSTYGKNIISKGPSLSKESTPQYNYLFDCWINELGKDATNQLTFVSCSMKVYAKFQSKIRSYSVSFYDEFGSLLVTEQVNYDSTCVFHGTQPQKASTSNTIYTFIGWTNNPTTQVLVDLNHIKENLVLSPVFSSAERKYTLTVKVTLDGQATDAKIASFDLYINDILNSSQINKVDTSVKYSTKASIKNLVFDTSKYYLNTTVFKENYQINENTYIIIPFTSLYSVSYQSNVGSFNIPSETASSTNQIVLHNTLTLKDEVVPAFEVSFYDNKGNTILPSQTSYNTISYSFVGWKDQDGKTYQSNEKITLTKNLVLTALWNSSSQSSSITLPAPSSISNYDFDGWYNSSSSFVGHSGDKYTPLKEISLYAFYSPKSAAFVSQYLSTGTVNLEDFGYTLLDYISTGTNQWMEKIPLNQVVGSIDFSYRFISSSASIYHLLTMDSASLDYCEGNLSLTYAKNTIKTASSSGEFVSAILSSKSSLITNDKMNTNQKYSSILSNNQISSINLFENSSDPSVASVCQVYSLIIYAKDGSVVRCLLPAKNNTNGSIGLFDLANKEFFQSQSNQAFLAGPASGLYREMTEIYFTGKSVFDTQVTGESSWLHLLQMIDGKKEQGFGYSQTDNLFFGMTAGSQYNHNNQNLDAIYVGGCDSILDIYLNKTHTVTINGQEIYSSNYINMSTNTYSFGGIKDKRTSYCSYLLYYSQCMNNSSVLHTYVPVVRLSDCQQGLYDSVTGEFNPVDTLLYDRTYYEEIFDKDNTVLQPDITKFAMFLANAAYSSIEITHELDALAFDIILQDYKADDSEVHTGAFTLAKKQMNGKDVYVLVIRGTNGKNEWSSNFNIGNQTSLYHEGFEGGADYIIRKIADCFDDTIDDNVLLICGHSRGGPLSSIVTAKLTDSEVHAKKDKIFGYAFAASTYSLADRFYNNLFIHNNLGDIITEVPLKAWGYKYEGTVIELPTNSSTISALNKALSSLQRTQTRTSALVNIVGYTGDKDCNFFTTEMLKIFPTKEAYESSSAKTILEAMITVVFKDDNSTNVGDFSTTSIIHSLEELGFENAIEKYSSYMFSFLSGGVNFVSAHLSSTYLEWVNIIYK